MTWRCRWVLPPGWCCLLPVVSLLSCSVAAQLASAHCRPAGCTQLNCLLSCLPSKRVATKRMLPMLLHLTLRCTLQGYHSMADRLALIPATAKRAEGVNFEVGPAAWVVWVAK